MAAVALFIFFGGDWWLFGLFAVLPDLSILAYMGDDGKTRWPAFVYNTVHIYTLPIALMIVFWNFQPAYLLGWVAHIAIDRMFGFGLKSTEGFRQTHFQLLDRSIEEIKNDKIP